MFNQYAESEWIMWKQKAHFQGRCQSTGHPFCEIIPLHNDSASDTMPVKHGLEGFQIFELCYFII